LDALAFPALFRFSICSLRIRSGSPVLLLPLRRPIRLELGDEVMGNLEVRTAKLGGGNIGNAFSSSLLCLAKLVDDEEIAERKVSEGWGITLLGE
jgi:hypothetical protein